jgi:hypothetical protein
MQHRRKSHRRPLTSRTADSQHSQLLPGARMANSPGYSYMWACLMFLMSSADFATLIWPTCARLIWPTLTH